VVVTTVCTIINLANRYGLSKKINPSRRNPLVGFIRVIRVIQSRREGKGQPASASYGRRGQVNGCHGLGLRGSRVGHALSGLKRAGGTTAATARSLRRERCELFRKPARRVSGSSLAAV